MRDMPVTDRPESSDVTRLLQRARDGSREAFNQLMPLVYDELRDIARRQLRREQRPELFTTSLVHEVYERLVDRSRIDWQGRAHFFGIAARVMRQILVDQARKRHTLKRGGDWDRTSLSDRLEHPGPGLYAEDLVALDDALRRLEQLDPRQHRVVEYRFFGGMTEEEIAEVMGVSSRTVHRDWLKARAWLYSILYPDEKE
jgi:RNA polymerase sigma factor (TIGR02999 family)